MPARLFKELVELRRREPADDVISRLVAAEGDTLQPHEMLPMCNLLLVAGFETTVNLIGNAVNALLDHPEQWADLRADPAGLAEAAVEETLRWDPPVQRTARCAVEDLELAGRPVRRTPTTRMPSWRAADTSSWASYTKSSPGTSVSAHSAAG